MLLGALIKKLYSKNACKCEKHNAKLGPISQTTTQMQLNEGQYVMFGSSQMPLIDLHGSMGQ